jgi:hypothetical protein
MRLSDRLAEFADYWDNLTHVTNPPLGLVPRGPSPELREAVDALREWERWQKTPVVSTCPEAADARGLLANILEWAAWGERGFVGFVETPELGKALSAARALLTPDSLSEPSNPTREEQENERD